MKPAFLILVLVALLASASACAPQEEQSAAPAASAAQNEGTDATARAKKAAGIARAIQADPDSIDSILEKEGMTREEFEDLLYEIAADPTLSGAYLRELGG